MKKIKINFKNIEFLNEKNKLSLLKIKPFKWGRDKKTSKEIDKIVYCK